MGNHAILVANTLATLRQAWDIPTPVTVMDIYQQASQRQISHVWIHPSSQNFVLPPSHDEWSIKVNRRREGINSISIWHRGTQHPITLIFAQNTAWSWVQGCTPHELLTTIEAIESQLGVNMAGSPATTGWSYLKKLHPEWIETSNFDWQEHHFTAKAVKELIWSRARTPRERSHRYLHKFDKSSAYSAAAAQAQIGRGSPYLINDGSISVNHVGVWHVAITSAETLLLPPAWIGDREQWVMAPIVALSRSAGFSIKMHEAWIFPEQHGLLQQWARNLWMLRSQATPGGRLSMAYKDIPNKTIGLTAYHGFEAGDEARHPHIRLQVIARHREIMWHNLFKVWQVSGNAPIMTYMDAAYYLSDNPDGRQAVKEIVMREGQLGGFKYEGKIDCQDFIDYSPDNERKFQGTVSELLDSKLNVARKLEVLNYHGWEK